MKAKKVSPGSRISDIIIDLLINIPIFDSLSGDELSTIVQYMNYSEVEAGEVLFNEGDKVSFEVEEGEKGPQAINVKKLELIFISLF